MSALTLATMAIVFGSVYGGLACTLGFLFFRNPKEDSLDLEIDR